MSDKNENNPLLALRHSAEHIMHQAVKELFPQIQLAMGPATDDGFYNDFDPNGLVVTEADLPKIEKRMQELIDLDLPITQSFISEQEARELFKDNPYKQEWIDQAAKEGDKFSIYWTGKPGDKNSMVDFCRGPHVESTGKVKAFKLLSIAGAYWHGDEKNKMLTRIYGTAFENKEDLEKFVFQIEETKKRDHRKLGPQLGIFFLDETAPGMPYWLPKGTIIINELLSFWRKEHLKRGYLETMTPLLNKKQLYETSGHWDHYRENMFIADMGDEGIYCLKPMNCPNAMTIFGQGKHSYKELPLRYSDCDTLHRHEKSGQLSGLLRVQKFTQDDAHIFVSEDQIKDEYQRILDIAKLFYSIFNIKFRIRLGTRPDDFMGDVATWNKAETDLQEIMKNADIEYFIGKGEGAFYGPKLDIMMADCMGREWQTGTIQLDFQLPRNFKLKYTDKDGSEKTPVVIHRVIYGSLERFMGILIEHFAGNFPVWISPVQAKIIPITEVQNEYAQKMKEKLQEEGIRVEIDDRSETMQAKIRDAQIEKVPFMLVIGKREVEGNTIAVRQRDGQDLGAITVDEFLAKIKALVSNHSLNLIK